MASLTGLAGCQQQHVTEGPQGNLQYPATRKVDTVDHYFGTAVADPYRWLENDTAQEVEQWTEKQNQLTRSYLDSIPFLGKIHRRLQKLWNYPRLGAPFRKGSYYYFFKNDGLQNQAVLYQQEGLKGKPKVFLDPNTLAADGTAALAGIGFSKDGKYMAYSIARSGSDWQEAYVMETASGKVLQDTIRWIKFSGFAWKGDDGFYYSGYDEPDEKMKFLQRTQFQKVRYHKLGTTQDKDVMLYEDAKHPLRYYGIGLTEDERFLILSIAEGTSGNELWCRDLQDKKQTGFSLLAKGFDHDYNVVDNDQDRLLVLTNRDAPNYRLVSVDPRHPDTSSWQTVIAEKPEVLESVSTAGGSLFASYLKDAASRVYQYDYQGHLQREVSLPGIGTASDFGGNRDDSLLFYSFTSFTQPGEIFKYDLATGRQEIFQKASLNFDPDQFETKQVFYESKDGTRIPMFLSYRKGLKLNGQNPVLLYAYGGFNISMTPAFSPSNLFFMEQGGIYALANIRGGGEYGEKWHKAGMLEKKQNVFDDFIAAAEYLIREKYTSSARLAIRGGSNGGLLIGACMTQRPDLYKVAIPQVGVMDMLRYQKFTVGWGWVVEYGSSDSADAFGYLYKYSPLHNLKKGTCYPATLMTTADHDDRVVPGHSFKFAAALQADQGCGAPVLIRIDKKAGHGGGKPTAKQVDEAADIWAFVMYNLGMDFTDQ